MDKKQLNPPSLFLSSKATGHTGLIPPSHFETRRRIPGPPSPIPVPPTPPVTELWADLARELDQLRKENEELKKKQTRGEGIRARSLERQPSAVPHSESQALEIIAHQMREIRSLELAVADVQGKEEVVQRLTGELQELRRTQRECQLTEEKKRRAEESAVRQQQEELMMRSESYKMESETLRKRAQSLEVELREEREQRTQEMARLREDLQAANQERETLKEQLSKSLLELDSQHSLVQQLRTYIGELVPDNRRLEEQKKEKLELQNTIQALEREREALQTSISLLNTRLSSLTNILSLQEGELCKKVVQGDGEKSRLLLSRWREKVFCLMVQMKSEEINRENDSRKIKEKISSLDNSLEASVQQQVLLSHSLQDRTAELDMEKVKNKSLQDELLAERSASAHLCSRAERAEQAVRHLKQLVENFVHTISAQEASQIGALSHLVTLGQRVSFASKRVDTIQGLIAQKFALMRLSQEEKPQGKVTDIFLPSYEDLQTELALLHEERDRLSAELKRSALMVESKVAETREKLEAEITDCQKTTSVLRQSLYETQESERHLKSQLQEMETRLRGAEENMSQLSGQLQTQQEEYEKALQSRVSEVETQLSEQLAQLEKHLHEARREHTKAVVALRQTERQAQREKARSQETMCTLEGAAKVREDQLSQQLREAERDKNLMMATLRQEGLLSAYQRNRLTIAQDTKGKSEQEHSKAEARSSEPSSALSAKESISSMLANLQSLGDILLNDDEEEEPLIET